MSRPFPAGAMPHNNGPAPPLHHQPQAPPQGAPMPLGARGPAPFHHAPPARSRHTSSYASSSSSIPTSYPTPPSPPPGAVPRDLRPRDAVPISDLRHERLTEADARELLSTFYVIRLERAHNPNDVDSEGYALKPSWDMVHQYIQTNYPQEDARRRVAQLMKETKPVYEKKRAKEASIQRQIEIVLDDFSRRELDPRFIFTLAQFESQYRRLDDRSVSSGRRRRSHRHHHSRKSRKHSNRSRSPRKERQAIIIYLKRTPAKGENGLRMLQEENQRKARRDMPPAPTVHIHPGTAGYPPVAPHPAPIYSAPTSHHSSPQARSPPASHHPSPPTRSAPAPHHPPPNHAVPTAPVNPVAPPMNPNMRGQPQPTMPAKPGMREGLSRPPSRAQPRQPQQDFDGAESGDESGEGSDEEDTMPPKQVNPAHPRNPGNMAPRTAPAPLRPGVALPRPGPGNPPVNPNAAPAPRGPPNMLANPNVAPGPRGPPPNMPANPNAAGPRGPPLNQPANPNAAPAPRGPPNMPPNPNVAPGPRGASPNLPANLNAAPALRGPPPAAPRPGPVPNTQAPVPPPNAPGRAAPPAQATGVNPGRMPNPQARPSFDPHAAPQKPGVSPPEMRPQPNDQVKLRKPPVGPQVNAPGSPATAKDHIIVTTTIGGKRRGTGEYIDSDRSSPDSAESDDCFSADESEGTRPSSVGSDSGSRRNSRDQSSARARKDRHAEVKDSHRNMRDSDDERSSRHVSRPRARFHSPSRRGESLRRRRESPQRRGESSYHREESPRRRREPSHRRRESPHRRRESPHRRREESRSPRRDYHRDDNEWVPRRESELSPRVVQRNPAPRLVSVPEAKREIYADHENSRRENRLERVRREDDREREIWRDNDRLRDLGDRGFRHRRGLRSRIFDLLGDEFSHGSRDSRWREGDAREYMRRSADFDRLRPLREREFFRRD
ncbi:hypothetical protein BHE90_013364 [Fusarium euwallaceae]|uniref:Uncharacterized protein n=1 Tax=Fusarium euwallaceae TaxID=1147111 RepID=A0A430L991_9HYPO|nr:hypothetical protein BHE90_013364 [Fusarium euwallaceae]